MTGVGPGEDALGRAYRRAVRVLVRGRVQGVGFRAWTAREARRRGLAGWVRNRADGAVEAVLAGPAEAVAAMVEACRSGPTFARVDGVDLHQEGAEESGTPEGFRILTSERGA